MWLDLENGTRQFVPGRQNDEAAAQAAQQCGKFHADDEDEWVADEEISCFNCRYRRWTVESFHCLKTV